MFANAAQEYMDKYVATLTHLAQIAAKNHQHSFNNPYGQFHRSWSVEQVLAAPKINNQLTMLMCSATSDGAARCIVASEDFVHAHGLENKAIEIVALELCTDEPSTFESKSPIEVVGHTMTKNCADKVFRKAGSKDGEGRDQVGVIELHDCFSANELLAYESLACALVVRPTRSLKGATAPSVKVSFLFSGMLTPYAKYGGKYVVNPSGGLEAKGHPLGATGLEMHFFYSHAIARLG